MAEDGNVRVIAHFAVKAEHVDEFRRRALRDLVAPTRDEAGCISYELWQHTDEPTRFAMVESWRSREDLDRHLAQPSLREALTGLLPLGDGQVTTGFYRRVEE